MKVDLCYPPTVGILPTRPRIAGPDANYPNAGFQFEKEYLTIPGSTNLLQVVKRWRMSKGRFLELYWK